MSSRLRRFAVLLAAVCAAVVVPAGSASAHAFLVNSDPADGAVLSSAPQRLQLQFSESIELAATHVTIVGQDGRDRRPTSMALVTAPAGSQVAGVGRPVLLVVGLPALTPDAYRISWETISSDDLHRTSGVFVFGLQHAAKAAGLHETPPALPESALRWLLFLGLAVALGATLLAALHRPDRDGPFTDAAMRRCRDLALAGSVGALLVSAGLLVEQASASHESLARLLPSSYGTRWLVRESGLLLLALVMYGRCRRGRSRGGVAPGAVLRWLTVLAASVSAVGFALMGHAGAGVASPTRIAADAAHLLAAATWSGTLLTVAMVVVPRLRSSGGEAVATRAALRRFLVPALVCVAVMVVTGVYLASGVVGSVDALILTTYGRILLAKLAVVAVVGALGLANSAALHRPRSGRKDRPRFLVPEALAAATVLGLTALLTSGQPAREPQLVRYSADRVVPVMDGAAQDLQETLEVRPNVPGANVVLVGVFDTRRPSPGVVRGVDVVLERADGTPSTTITLTPLADGQWSAHTTLTTSGASVVRVTVHRQGLPDAPASYRWVVGGAPDQTRKAVVSTAPLARPLELAAVGLLAVELLAAGCLALRWRRREEPADFDDQGAARELADAAGRGLGG
ncbi:MAG: copper transport protein [Frankiales bacterium]|nr:copper transport protein [Frankiales bacterium]